MFRSHKSSDEIAMLNPLPKLFNERFKMFCTQFTDT